MKQRGNNPTGKLVTWLRQQESPEATNLLNRYRKNHFRLTPNEIDYGFMLMDSAELELLGGIKDIPPGFYVNKSSGYIYRVEIGERGYALSWRDMNSTRWTNKNINIINMKLLVASGSAILISEEEAIAIGMKTGICVICGKTLTDAKSLKYGIGPLCRKRVISVSKNDGE